MRIYELNYFLSGKLSPEEIQGASLKVESLIQEQGGVLTSERKSKQVNLGQEIKGNKKAVLANTKFQIEPEKIKVLKEQLKKTSEVLRFMVIIKPIIKIRPERKRLKVVTKPTEEKAPTEIKAESEVEKEEEKPKKEKKVELEQIEKKLDEILED